MAQYRRLPVIVDAFQWTGGPDQTEDPQWMVDAMKAGEIEIDTSMGSQPRLVVQMGMGYRGSHASGVWVVRDAIGKIRTLSPSEFANTYEPVPIPVSQGCEIPPAGWLCTREKGHEGPCAAHPVDQRMVPK